MNRIIFCCVVLLNTTTIWSQQSAPGISFQKPLGGSSHEISFTNKNTIDGGFIIGGVSSSRDGDIARSKGSADLWVVKMKNNNTIQWEKTLGGSNKEKGTIVNEIKNADGSSAGFFVGGTTSSSNGDVKGYKGGASDIWIVKLNTAGVIIWQRALGGSDVDEIISMETAPDGGCIVAGNTKSRNGDVTGSRGAEDIWIVKLSATGILLWQKTFGTAGSETVQDIEVSSDGSIVVIGRLWNSIINNDITEYRGSTDWWIVKLNSLGQKMWHRTLGGSGTENTFISIRSTNDNGYIIGGGSDSGDGDLTGLGLGGNFGYWVVKLNNSGGIVWQWADNKGGNLYDIRQTKDGGYIICGNGDDGNPATAGSALFVKLNSAGTVVWKKNYGGTSSSEPYNIQETSDGQFLAIASTQSKELPGFHYHSYAPDVWIIKIDNNGNKVWEKCYGGTGEDWLRTGYSTTTNLLTHNVNSSNYQNEYIDKSGNIFFSVSTNSLDGDVKGLHKTSNDIWFVRLSQSFLTSSLTVASPSPKLFNENFSHSVYPNPFSQRATLAFTSGETAATRIEIFNAHGILLKNINAGMIRKGESYRYEVNLTDLPAGKYTYKLINGTNTGTGKLIKTN